MTWPELEDLETSLIFPATKLPSQPTNLHWSSELCWFFSSRTSPCNVEGSGSICHSRKIILKGTFRNIQFLNWIHTQSVFTKIAIYFLFHVWSPSWNYLLAINTDSKTVWSNSLARSAHHDNNNSLATSYSEVWPALVVNKSFIKLKVIRLHQHGNVTGTTLRDLNASNRERIFFLIKNIRH